jgi:hypothetical protein
MDFGVFRGQLPKGAAVLHPLLEVGGALAARLGKRHVDLRSAPGSVEQVCNSIEVGRCKIAERVGRANLGCKHVAKSAGLLRGGTHALAVYELKRQMALPSGSRPPGKFDIRSKWRRKLPGVVKRATSVIGLADLIAFWGAEGPSEFREALKVAWRYVAVHAAETDHPLPVFNGED